MTRPEAVAHAIAFGAPLTELKRELAAFPWDSEAPLGVVGRVHILAVLDRCLAGDLTADEVSSWANLLEARDDVGFESGHESEVKDAMWRLANPLLVGECETINRDLVSEVRERLSGGAA